MLFSRKQGSRGLFPGKQNSRGLFPGKQGSRVGNRSHNLFSIVKCCEKNKMDNAQNGYSSADNTGKIKKINFLMPLNPNLSSFFARNGLIAQKIHYKIYICHENLKKLTTSFWQFFFLKNFLNFFKSKFFLINPVWNAILIWNFLSVFKLVFLKDWESFMLIL